MDFTFGIITNGSNDLIPIIDSIEKQNIPNYEIIIVGGNPIVGKNITHIHFDETIKPMWITKKKNIITDNSKYENVVYLHDYIILEDGWYEGYLKYGNEWNVCMNKIINEDGSRFRDWNLWIDDANNFYSTSDRYLLPYNMIHLSKMMYISGAYWVAKNKIMKKYRLNEKLSWSQGEDVEWSIRVRNTYDFNMNEYSVVKLLKQKQMGFKFPYKNELEILKNIKDYNRNEETYNRLIKNHLREWI